MRKILIYLAHPRLDRSEVHASLMPLARAHSAVTLVDLYRDYPDYAIDVAREQKRLLAHDVILFQHPVFWYSTPAILKEWQDLVLEWGFAYGHGGDKLHGKGFGQIISAGRDHSDYARRGDLRYSMEEFFVPLKLMADTCGMHYLAPLAIYKAGHAKEEGRIGEFQEAYSLYLDTLADRANAYGDIHKRDDVLSVLRNLVRG